jgi:hypothetical protein
MTGADDALALAFASGLPFAGLRDHEHDPGLDGVVPPQAAHAARVVLLAVDDGRVRLAAATAQPDLGALTAYLGDRRVELAISPADEIEAILGPPPGPAEVAAPAPEPEVVAKPEPEPAAEPEPPAPEHAGELDEPSSVEPARRSRPRIALLVLVVLLVLAAGVAAGVLLAR